MDEITIKNAKNNNLKNISLNIPHNNIIGITGVSGSGKSTLARDVITQYGYKNFLVSSNKTLKHEFLNDVIPEVDYIKNLNPVVFIDVINSVNSRMSTLSTITGIHNFLRKIFYNYGKLSCKYCNHIVENDIYKLIEDKKYKLKIESEVTKDFQDIIKKIEDVSKVSSILYYDKNFKLIKNIKNAKFATIFIDKPNKKLNLFIKDIKRLIDKQILVEIEGYNYDINPQLETICSHCGEKVYRKSLKKLSFNISSQENGGACEKCQGMGSLLTLDYKDLIEDESKPILKGSIRFVSEKGIQYTQVTLKEIEEFCKKSGFTKNSKLDDLSEKQMKDLFYGNDEIITYSVKKEKRSFLFKGIVNYLAEALRKGKGEKYLKPIFKEVICDNCEGTRLNKESELITVFEHNIKDLLKMSIEELLDFFENVDENIEDDIKMKSFVRKLIDKLEVYCRVSCGYLTLDRQSNTLSGGELQRLRMCSYISQSINNTCIVLDEPSTGLHPKDIINLIKLLFELKKNNNTILLVEHNKHLLRHCDYIIDLGPEGGSKGGNLLFTSKLDDIDKYNTYTTEYLNYKIDYKEITNYNKKLIDDTIEVLVNDGTKLLEIPKGFLVSICGISGGGKSTFVKNTLMEKLTELKSKIIILNQNLGNSNSNVCSLIKIQDKIAKIFAKISDNKEYKNFMINTTLGKCDYCQGKGYIYSLDKDNTGVCPVCLGNRFSKEILSVKYKNYSIKEILSMSLDELCKVFEEEKKIKDILITCKKLGIGYLSLDREAKSLSKGEYQRIRLACILINKEKDSIFLLDEPTKALHYKDLKGLIEVLRDIQKNNNTIITIEHNIEFIIQSDYIIEIGPLPGKRGGQIIFDGYPCDFYNVSTPTSSIIKNNGYKVLDSDTYINRNITLNDILSDKSIDLKKYIIDLEKVIRRNYVSCVLPNYIYSDSLGDIELQSFNIPLIRSIDFMKNDTRTKENILEFLNISDDVALLFSQSTNNSIDKYIFNYKKKAGKCPTCKGKGIIDVLELDYLFDNGDLSKDTIKFLMNGSSYESAKKELKKLYNLDISKKISDMSLEERNLFLYGDETKQFSDKKKKTYWNGLINLIITQGKYYPDKSIIEALKQTRKYDICDACKGELLSKPYNSYKVFNLTYSELICSTFNELDNKISNECGSTYLEKKIIKMIKTLVSLGLGDLTLNTKVSKLNNLNYGKIKLVGFYYNRLYKTVLAISNFDLLTNSDITFIKNMLSEMKEDTSVIFI